MPGLRRPVAAGIPCFCDGGFPVLTCFLLVDDENVGREDGLKGHAKCFLRCACLPEHSQNPTTDPHISVAPPQYMVVCTSCLATANRNHHFSSQSRKAIRSGWHNRDAHSMG